MTFRERDFFLNRSASNEKSEREKILGIFFKKCAHTGEDP